MKLTFLALLLSSMTLSLRAQSGAISQHKHISVISISKEVFYFKADADFIGATVEVTDSTGTVFFSAELHAKRNLIDFFYLEKGRYNIHFEHNGVTEDYQVWLEKKEAHDAAPFIAFEPRA